MAFRLNLLGGARIRRDGAPLDGPASQRQRLAILAFIAGSGGSVSRERTLAMLWPESDAVRARHALANALYALRGALGDDALVSSGEELRLDPLVVGSDVIEFEEAIRNGDLAGSADLYGGPFLDGFSVNSVEFERWTDTVRDRLRSLYVGALESLAVAATAEGDAREALGWWQRLAAETPHSAHATTSLMRGLERAGEPADALKQARVHALLLEADLGAGPDAAVEALAAEIEVRMATTASHSPSSPRFAASPEAGRLGSDPKPLASAVAVAPKPRLRRSGAGAIAVLLTGVSLIGAFAMMRSSAPAAAADSPPVRSLAVLPLNDLSPNPDDAYFAEAMTEVLTAELSLLDSLTVVSRTSASRFASSDLTLGQIASRLDVDGVVEGSVFRAGDQVRVTVQLIRGDTDEHIWAESYEATTEDPIGLQRQVAQEIAAALSLSLSPDEQRRLTTENEVNQPAQEAFFKGIYHFRRFTKASVGQAVLDFEEATRADPTFAEPAAMAATSYWILTQVMTALPPDVGMPRARAWAERALTLDPSSAEALTALGWVSLLYDRDTAAAEEAFNLAIQAQPDMAVGHNGLSFVQMVTGRPEDALASGRRAISRNRLDLGFRTALAELYYFARRFDQALAELDELLEIDPEFSRAHLVRRWVLEAREEWSEAAQAHEDWLRSASEEGPGVDQLMSRSDEVPGRGEYWRWRLRGLEQDSVALSHASLEAWALAELGDVDEAFVHLERALAQREGQLVFLGVQPAWDRIRDDPRFQHLLERMGLVVARP